MTMNYDVIICGAGPTGMMLANQLARFNINFLIIDGKAEPTKESRALVVQARSMEIYEQMNLSDKIIAEGQKLEGVLLYKNGKRKAAVILGELAKGVSPFPYLMVYEQSKIEQLLYDALRSENQDVEWNTAFVKYSEKDNGFDVVISSNNVEKTISTTYLIACDGSKSKVREQSGVAFEGSTYQNVFYLADTHVKADISHDKLNLFTSKHDLNVLFPMKGENRYRIIGILPKEYYHKPDLNFDEMINHFRQTTQLPVQVYDTKWSSTYRIHHKKIKQFRKGNIFFAGDAAHVHSPAGGQGMNTGLQDAYNLAWKLAFVIKKKAKESLLNTYHKERNPIAIRLLQTTDRFFNFMIKQSWFYVLFRTQILLRIVPVFVRSHFIKKQIFAAVSQTSINYNKSFLSKGKSGRIKAGARFPYTMIEDNGQKISIYQYFKQINKPFLLVSFNININDVKNDNLHAVSLPVNTTNISAFKKLRFDTKWIALVRPDMYIGYICSVYNEAELSEYYNRIFAGSSQ